LAHVDIKYNEMLDLLAKVASNNGELWNNNITCCGGHQDRTERRLPEGSPPMTSMKPRARRRAVLLASTARHDLSR